jgi:antitoxin ParD1/3/4
MNVTIRDHWEHFIEYAVKTGQFGSPEDVVLEGLRLVEQRDAKLNDLRGMLNASIAAGGHNTVEDLNRGLDEVEEELRREGL